MFRSINRYSICVVRFLEETICVDELTKSDELIEFGEFPDFWEAEKDIPHLSKAMFHQCHFAVNPQNIYLLHALILFWKSMNMTRQVKMSDTEI